MELTINLLENLAISLQSNKQNLPNPEEILALRPSQDLQNKIDEFLEKNRLEGLNESEEQIWASYEFIEHLVRIAKAEALKQVKK